MLPYWCGPVVGGRLIFSRMRVTCIGGTFPPRSRRKTLRAGLPWRKYAMSRRRDFASGAAVEEIRHEPAACCSGQFKGSQLRVLPWTRTHFPF